jgi:hypothetical protein
MRNNLLYLLYNSHTKTTITLRGAPLLSVLLGPRAPRPEQIHPFLPRISQCQSLLP